ncbi:hypothetical protein JCM6882_004254 [Rhodosporidiobolus microsporus]
MPRSATLLLSLAALVARAVASPVEQLQRRALTDQGGFYDPRENGGNWLTLAHNTYPAGLGEPLNIVVSAESDPLIMTDEGFFDWAESLQYGRECLGQSDGEKQSANLGDGKGQINQTILLRYNYGDPYIGTCWETINGGGHFRIWRQNGSEANSGAWFLAASEEMNLSMNHMIVDNGYDLGRDAVVSYAVQSGGTKSPLTNRTFTTESRNATQYYDNISVYDINHRIATDGVVMVLTVKVTSNGSVDATSGTVATHAITRSDLYRLSFLGLFSIFALGLLA